MNKGGYIKSLDGLRAIAILLVLSLHTGVIHFGWIGVQLFFVLSGYLITGILWKEKSREESISHKLKKFWVRRSLRILPLYFGYLLILSLAYLFFHFPASYRAYIVYLLTYSYNFTRGLPGWTMEPAFAHLWSLAIEEQFYLLFPLVLFFGTRRFIRVFMWVVIIVAPLVRFLLGQYFIRRGFGGETLATIVYWNTLSQLDAFFMGGMISVLSLDKSIRKPHILFGGSLLLVLLAGVLNYTHQGFHNFFLTDLGYGFGQAGNYAYVWQYSLLNVLFAGFILVLVSGHTQNLFPRMRNILENKWMVNIGKVSYGMYIYHWMIWYYLFENTVKPANHYLWRVGLYLPYLAVVYVVASLSFRFYENYFIKLKDRFFPASAPGRGAGTSAGTNAGNGAGADPGGSAGALT